MEKGEEIVTLGEKIVTASRRAKIDLQDMGKGGRGGGPPAW